MIAGMVLAAAMALTALLGATSCGVPEEEHAGLLKDHRISNARVDSLTALVRELQDRPQYLWETALDHLQAGDEDAAEETLQDLVRRFPESRYLALTQEKLREAHALRARREKELDRAYRSAIAEVAEGSNPAAGLARLSAFLEEHPGSKYEPDILRRVELLRKREEDHEFELTMKRVTAVPTWDEAVEELRGYRQRFPSSAHDAEVEEEIAERIRKIAQRDATLQALKDVGLSVEGLRTGWEEKADVLGGQAMLVPCVRFNARNDRKGPISRLTFRASFNDPSERKKVGDGVAYSVTTTGSPLRSEYRTHVTLCSGVGYVGFGALVALANLPELEADIFVEVNGGDRTQILTTGITPKWTGL